MRNLYTILLTFDNDRDTEVKLYATSEEEAKEKVAKFGYENIKDKQVI